MMNEYANKVIGVIPPQCPECKKPPVEIKVQLADYQRWIKGELIQRAFPEMPVDQRELLMTGMHSACWDALWQGADDNECDEEESDGHDSME